MGEHTKAEMLQRLLTKIAIKERRRAPLPARMAVNLFAVRTHGRPPAMAAGTSPAPPRTTERAP